MLMFVLCNCRLSYVKGVTWMFLYIGRLKKRKFK